MTRSILSTSFLFTIQKYINLQTNILSKIDHFNEDKKISSFSQFFNFLRIIPSCFDKEVPPLFLDFFLHRHHFLEILEVFLIPFFHDSFPLWHFSFSSISYPSFRDPPLIWKDWPVIKILETCNVSNESFSIVFEFPNARIVS